MDNTWHKPWLVKAQKDHTVFQKQGVNYIKSPRKRVWKDRNTSGSTDYSPTSSQTESNHSSINSQEQSRSAIPCHRGDLGSNEMPGQKLPLSNANFNDDRPKKALNVDSPSFTPATISSSSNKGVSSITSQAANAAPFTPRGLTSGTATPNAPLDPEIPQFNPTQRDFTPQNYDLSQTVSAPIPLSLTITSMSNLGMRVFIGY